MRWQIKPLVGVGPLRLGMTVSEVASLLDHESPVENKIVNEEGSFVEGRGVNQVVCHYHFNHLSGVVLSRLVENVYYEEMDIFRASAKDVLAKFAKANHKQGKFGFGSAIFPQIGINARGFYLDKGQYFSALNSKEDERGVGVFSQDEFAGALIEDLKTVYF